jgi:hypothetical protein
VSPKILSAIPLLLAALTAIGASCASGSPGGGGQSSATTQGQHGGAGGQGSTSSAGGGTGGTSTKACTGDGDCDGDPHGALCDTTSGACVACLPANDTCAAGTYCNGATHTCQGGCKADTDCAGDPSGKTHCAAAIHQCVHCVADADCGPGTICDASGGVCVAGCTPSHDCAAGQTCCGDACRDLTNDLANCGTCDNACPPLDNADGKCVGGMCTLQQCRPDFVDCNGDMSDGCEHNLLLDGPCTCTPGQKRSCYQGDPATQDVGPCHAGTQTCDASGTAWGACTGQVMPVWEICNNGVDDDCDGFIDNVPDIDGDGWTLCDGDCCEVPGPGCTNPKLVNPGAYEVVGDGVDNDCDPSTSDTAPPTSCATAQKFAGVSGADVAAAMELCQTTTLNPPLAQKRWGLISATQLFANGAVPNAAEIDTMQNLQTAVMTKFGTGGIVPTKGATMAAISTGTTRAPGDPSWVTPAPGTSFAAVPGHSTNVSIAFPGAGPLATYLAAHGGGLLPGRCGTTACPVGIGANDSIDIQLQIRVPTNAQGFSYDFRFFSSEYWNYQCTNFNDYYLAMLTSGTPSLPADHNVSFDALHNAVSVNNGFFQDCVVNSKHCGTCPFGVGSLAGTGFDGAVDGGATEWLTTDSPVVPGEVMTLELILFDSGGLSGNDHSYDTLILLDNFRWQITPVALGTHT